VTDIRFSHENLDAYTVSLEFLDLATEIARRLPRAKGQVGDQIQRASESICLRIAEGSGMENRSAEQRRHYLAARASALECAAVLDVARARKALSDERRAEGRLLLDRIVRMLSKLAPRR
jgi:four helix bundle protein